MEDWLARNHIIFKSYNLSGMQKFWLDAIIPSFDNHELIILMRKLVLTECINL